MTPKKVTIDRAKWATGRYFGPADFGFLLNPIDGRRCCLGFLGAACGLADQDAEWEPSPSGVKHLANWPSRLFELVGWTVPEDPGARYGEHTLAHINDFRDIDDPTRESWIAAGFKYLFGIEVEFIGEYPGTGRERCA